MSKPHLLPLRLFIHHRMAHCRRTGEPFMPVYEAQQHERHVAAALRNGLIVPKETLHAYPYFKQPTARQT